MRSEKTPSKPKTFDVPEHKKDYYQRLAYTKQRSRYNKNVISMAWGGKGRSNIAMRWLSKPRFVYLMEKINDQIARGDNGWIGSLNSIIRLVRVEMSKLVHPINKEAKAEKFTPMRLAKKPEKTPFKKSYFEDVLDNYVIFEKSATVENANRLMDSVWDNIHTEAEFSSYPLEPYCGEDIQKAINPMPPTVPGKVGEFFDNIINGGHQHWRDTFSGKVKYKSIKPVYQLQLDLHANPSKYMTGNLTSLNDHNRQVAEYMDKKFNLHPSKTQNLLFNASSVANRFSKYGQVSPMLIPHLMVQAVRFGKSNDENERNRIAVDIHRMFLDNAEDKKKASGPAKDLADEFLRRIDRMV